MRPNDKVIQFNPTPVIEADYADNGNGIDRASVRLEVNGADVTRWAQVTERGVRYTPAQPFPAGP